MPSAKAAVSVCPTSSKSGVLAVLSCMLQRLSRLTSKVADAAVKLSGVQHEAIRVHVDQQCSRCCLLLSGCGPCMATHCR